VFAVKKIRKKSVKERVKERDNKKREVERGCVADCVIKSLISVTSSWWCSGQQRLQFCERVTHLVSVP
jgi:hypothetical protein